MTNREAHEEAAGMGLDDMFFRFNRINPDEEYKGKPMNEQQQTVELLQCPFCAGTTVSAGRLVSPIHEPIGKPWSVHCRTCKSSTEPKVTYEEAVKAWNTRDTTARQEAGFTEKHCLGVGSGIDDA